MPLTPALSPQAGRGSPRRSRGRVRGGGRAAFALLSMLLIASAGGAGRLPVIGPAPPFVLTAQDGKQVALADLRGKVVAVAFIYTECPDICPLLTEKMVRVQDALGT